MTPNLTRLMMRDHVGVTMTVATRKRIAGLATLLSLGASFAVAWWLAQRNDEIETYGALVSGLVVSIAFIGVGIAGHPSDALVNQRNLMSLSRTQMVAWTVVLIPGFAACSYCGTCAEVIGCPCRRPILNPLATGLLSWL